MRKHLKKYWSVKNVLRGAFTTLIGVAFILAGLFLIYKSIDSGSWDQIVTTITEGITLIGTGLYLLGIEDPRLPRKPMGAMLLIVSVGISGCVTPRKCLDKFGRDSVRITIRDTIRFDVAVPGDNLEGRITEDSLSLLLAGKIDSLSKLSSSKNLEVKFWIDKYSRSLRYSAQMKPDTVVVDRMVEVMGDCPPVVVIDPDQALRWHEKLWKKFQFLSAYLVLAGLLLVCAVLIFKKI